ncbi:MAG TPA: hypothetical protein VHX37_00580 [Acidobacteriaceae bacterium]|nr:hypothetical protein [Acidobacteriaceae bacterium]
MASLMVSLMPTLYAQNNCGNAAAPPKITSATVDPNDPTGQGHLDLQSIEYVAGDSLQVQLLTDGCTSIQSIQVGSITLTPAVNHSGTLPNYYWYSSVDTQNNTAGHGYSISMGFPEIVDGSTDEVTLTMARTGGTGTAAFSFPLVHVSHVQPANADSAIGISGVEVHNTFAAGLSQYFSVAANSLINKTRVEYQPASLDARIDGTGIWLSFNLEAEVTCKPKVNVTGTFVLDTNAPGHVGLSVRWVNPATAHVQATLCTVAGQVLNDITLGLLGGNTGNSSAESQLTKLIEQNLPDTSAVDLFLDGSTTQTDQLLINLKLPAPSVEIDVPYSAFDVTRSATRLPPGQVMTLIANGLGMRDAIAGVVSSPPAVLESGPDGVPEHTAATLSNEYTVARTGALVDPGAAVGQLLARFPASSIVVTGSSDYRYHYGCKLTAAVKSSPLTGPPQILFGVNDTTGDAQRLRALAATGYKLRVLFGLPGTACSEYTHQLANQSLSAR